MASRSLWRGKRCILLFASCLLLTGCIPEDITKEEKNRLTDKAEEIMAAYLDENFPGAQITSADLLRAMEEGKYAYIMTDYVSGSFVYQEETYKYVVDTAEGMIYTSVCLEAVLSTMRDHILESMDIAVSESDMAGHELYCLQYRKDYGQGLDRSGFSDVFPADASVEEIVQDILTEGSAYALYATIQYKGEDIPEALLETKPIFDSLKKLDLYHIRQDMDMTDGPYEELLTCVSGEVLKMDHEKNISSFVKNKMAERDDLCVVYSALTRMKKEGSITETVTDEEDIRFGVTDDYIELVCEKEGCNCYLFTKDPKITREYVYKRKPGHDSDKEAEFEKGSWRAMKDRYVYSGVYGYGYVFNRSGETDHGSGNRIYTELGMEKVNTH